MYYTLPILVLYYEYKKVIGKILGSYNGCLFTVTQPIVFTAQFLLPMLLHHSTKVLTLLRIQNSLHLSMRSITSITRNLISNPLIQVTLHIRFCIHSHNKQLTCCQSLFNLTNSKSLPLYPYHGSEQLLFLTDSSAFHVLKYELCRPLLLTGALQGHIH